MELETINKLYLELSQITTATTAREILLQKQLAEVKADNEHLLAANLDCIDHFEAMRDDLDEAQRYAERYRSLRRGQKWSVIDWKGDALRADDLDAAIDAAKGEGNG